VQNLLVQVWVKFILSLLMCFAEWYSFHSATEQNLSTVLKYLTWRNFLFFFFCMRQIKSVVKFLRLGVRSILILLRETATHPILETGNRGNYILSQKFVDRQPFLSFCL